jgi:hypothetical protein
MTDYKMVMSKEFIGAVKRGAFDHWVGETVPVRGPDRQIIGEATVTSVDHHDDGTVAVKVSTELALDYDGLARITGTLCGRDSMSFAPVEPDPAMPLLDALAGKGNWHWDDDTPPVKLPHQPRRDDDVAKWLKAKRDEDGYKSTTYWEIDTLLDEYRARADYGLTLDAPLSELPDGY